MKEILAGVLIAACVSCGLSNYVAQQRYQTVGFCPPGVAGHGPSLMVFDSLDPTVYCLELPSPPPSSPLAPDDQKVPS